ncbi:SDR family oxidoreductase [Parasedimentitalea psychrophila]|uniref:SDR family oxidoreductase n=1 Tax=Parasedimentitalea psychrophila TaxID=2997337 RepID=A0A9Y2KZI9_9RHOB|nr:SDR family oxidoreductase [Parasedimentitalea psychrophila]WIY24762.1 SDR family oxidoreductase [Parasedimentitalea psychrophila]
MRLANKTAFITAAGAGIGRATALAYAREGARVIATDINADALDSLRAELADISAAGHEVAVLDVTNHDAVKGCVAAHRDVNVLFNCAGYVHEGTLESTSSQDWDRSFDINVKSMFLLTQAFLPHFIANGGASVICMSSAASSLKGVPNRFAYTVTKAAVLGFIKSVAADYIGDGIRVNGICPGTVDSPSLAGRINQAADPEAAWKAFVARQPIGRVGTAEEIAAIALHLAGDESAYTTGTWVVADGGITL